MRRLHTTTEKLAALKQGVELPVDPYALAHAPVGYDPATDERAVLGLARLYSCAEDPDAPSVSWASQVKAAAFFNAHGLLGTLSEIGKLEKASASAAAKGGKKRKVAP